MKQKNAGEVFGKRLRAVRKALGLKQFELARRSGIPSSILSNYELNRKTPSFPNLMQLIKTLGVTADYILGFSPDISGAPSRPGQDRQERVDALAEKFMVARLVRTGIYHVDPFSAASEAQEVYGIAEAFYDEQARQRKGKTC